MCSLPPASFSINYPVNDGFSKLSARNGINNPININSSHSYLPINNDFFKVINSINNDNSPNLLVKNNITSISINNDRFSNYNNNDGNPSNLSVVLGAGNIRNSINNIPHVNNNVYKFMSYINGNNSPNILAKSTVFEERSSIIPATKVLEEMHKTLKLDTPPVFTFRQETITRNFFCSACFMDKWYDNKEALPNKEEAKEAAAQNLLKIIMNSKEYENYTKEKQSTPGEYEKYLEQRSNKSNEYDNYIEEKRSTSSEYEKYQEGRQSTSGEYENYIEERQSMPGEYEKYLEEKYNMSQQANVSGLSKSLKNLHINPVFPENPKRRRKRNRGGSSPYKLNQNQRMMSQKISRRRIRKKSHRQSILQKNAERRKVAQANHRSIPVPEQENKPKKVKFDDKILILGEDIIPKSNSSMGLRSIMNQKDQSSSQYNQSPSKPETYQTLVEEFSDKDILPSKLLYEFCIISSISKPMYNLRNDYGDYIAEIIVGGIKYTGDKAFWHPDDAQERVAENAFNILYAKSDVDTKMKFKGRILYTLPNRLSDMPVMPSEEVASLNSPLRYEQPSLVPGFSDYNNPCMQQFGFPSSHDAPIESSPQQTFKVSKIPSTFDANPNLDDIQQTQQKISTQVQSKSTGDFQHQSNESTTSILHRLVNEKGWGVVEYQPSKTLQGYKCSCYVKKLRFTSNNCIDKETARDQAAKMALLALTEYDNEFRPDLGK